MLNSRIFRQIKIVAYILLPIVLWILPATFFDHGPAICLSQVFFHATCPGCGITRGIMHLMHFDLNGALAYNKLSIVVLPMLFGIWVKDLRKDIIFLLRTRPGAAQTAE